MLKFFFAFLATGCLFLGASARDVKFEAAQTQNKKPIVSRTAKGKKKSATTRKAVVRKSSSSKKSVASRKVKAVPSKKKVVRVDEFDLNKGSFLMPLEEGTIKTAFGPYKVGLGNIMNVNPGITLEANKGSLVKSVFDGVVTMLFSIEGNLGVIVRHGNYLSVYSNLASVNVSKDDKISSGDIIGKAASNEQGNAELEFLLMKKNKNIDPAPWIKK